MIYKVLYAAAPHIDIALKVFCTHKPYVHEGVFHTCC